MNETLVPTPVHSWPEDYQPRLFTVADLAEMPSELPSGTVYYELHHGRLITMPPAGDIHGAVEKNLVQQYGNGLPYQSGFDYVLQSAQRQGQ